VFADSSGPLVTARSSSVHGPDASGALYGAEPGVVVTVTVTGAAGVCKLDAVGATNEAEGVVAITCPARVPTSGADH
jgi:hypothetical protein